MTYCITYKINGINHIFRMPIDQGDNIGNISSLIRKEFAIIPKLTAKIYGSDIQSSKIISQSVQGQDVVTFDLKPTIDNPDPKLVQYRQVIITPRYISKTTFFVFTTINFKSMSKGDKIPVDINDSISKIKDRIKEMLQKNYSSDIKGESMNILLFLPGGIPFLKGTLNDFIKSFPEYMPHLYAIILFNPKITDELLNSKYNNVCDISTEEKKILISPVLENQTKGLCEMASVLGYIQRKAQNVLRMIYSIAKYCPFAPLICGLYNLAKLSCPSGLNIIQITAPLSILFIEMSKNLPVKTNLYSQTTKFLTYFMNININTRVPCTEFIQPFYKIGFENYFNDFIPDEMKDKVDSIIAFDPDFRDQDWIKFELPSLTEEDFRNAMENTGSLRIYPTMTLRRIHRTAIFMGKTGPYLFINPSVSKDKTKKDTIEYINPEIGEIITGKTEVVAKEMSNEVNKSSNKDYNVQNEDQIDSQTVKQFVFVAVDRSGSMSDDYFERITMFTAAQEFFTEFANNCYTFQATSLYGSILFDDIIDVRNPLNSLVTDFASKMVLKTDAPRGLTHMFIAIERATDIMINVNKNNDYPDVIYRVVVITDGYDNGSNDSQVAALINKLIQYKVRVDAIIVTKSIEPRLVELTRATGGIAYSPKSIQEGLEFFHKEEFFNVDMREFGPFAEPNFTADTVKGFRSHRYTRDQLTGNIKIKQNEYTKENQIVTRPALAVNKFNKQQEEINNGKMKPPKTHSRQKRIIQELRKIIKEQNPDIKVYPLKDRTDIWRVLIKGPENSPYENRWFYLTVEFPINYPEQYPMFRFIKPPYHPNITDQGRICLELFEKAYLSNYTIKNLLEEIITLLIMPNFEDPVDTGRFSLQTDMKDFKAKVEKWNNLNSKSSPDEWIKDWKIEDDPNIQDENFGEVSVPEHYLCPITHKIMKEPVLATSKIYYEKNELRKLLLTSNEPKCISSGKKLNRDENLNLIVDKAYQTQISKWVKDNNYHEEDEENDDNEQAAISAYKEKEKKDANIPKFAVNADGPMLNEVQKSASRIPPRPRPKLPDA